MTSVRRDFGGAFQQVRSLGQHWSVGLRGSAGSSTCLNEHLLAIASPVVEYNIFPYPDHNSGHRRRDGVDTVAHESAAIPM